MFKDHYCTMCAASLITVLSLTGCGSGELDEQDSSRSDFQPTAGESNIPDGSENIHQPQTKLAGDYVPSPSLPPQRPLYHLTPGDDLVRISKQPGYTGEVLGWHRVEINGQISTFTRSYLESIEFSLGDGNDVLIVEPDVEADIHANGGRGNDTLYGGKGRDKLNGLHDNDTIYGRKGGDYLIGSGGDDEIHGGNGPDYIYGQVGNNKIWGDGGHDYIKGGAGNDEIRGGANDDFIDGLHGDDVIRGGTGNDIIHGSFGDDVVYGQKGDDIIWGGPNDDILHGGPGSDEIHGGYYVAPGQEDFGGGPGNDQIYYD